MRKQLLFALALVLGLATAALAQVTNTGTITTTGAATCVTANSCVRLPATGSLPANSGAVSIQLGVTSWTGTVTIETTTDGTNYVTAQNCVSANATVTTMTANGQAQCNVGAISKIQVRGTSSITGTLTVTMTSSVAAAKGAPGATGSVTSIAATLPIVVTPNPITTTGTISCPTCGTGTLSGTTNFLSKFTTATNVGNSQAFESLATDEFFIRIGTAGGSSEDGTFWLTTDSTGDTTPTALNEILFATKDGAGADTEFANIQAGVSSTSAMNPLDIHTFKIGNGSNDDRILNYTFNDTTNAEFLSLSDDAIVYSSASSAYKIDFGWDTQVANDTGFRAFTTKIGNTTAPTAYIDNFYQGGTTYDKGGTTVLNAGGNPIDPLPLPKLNSTYNAGQCVGYSAAPGDLCGLFVWNGDARISDPTDNYVQMLNEPDFTTTTKWVAAGGFSFSGGKAVYANGGGTITQAQADLVSPAKGNRYYSFSYVTSSVTGSPECNLQSPGWDVYTGSPHSLELAAGAHILDGTVGPAFYFRTAASAPTDFVVTCSGTGTVSFDTLFLSLSAGGNLTVDGELTINGGTCANCVLFSDSTFAATGNAGFTFDPSVPNFTFAYGSGLVATAVHFGPAASLSSEVEIYSKDGGDTLSSVVTIKSENTTAHFPANPLEVVANFNTTGATWSFHTFAQSINAIASGGALDELSALYIKGAVGGTLNNGLRIDDITGNAIKTGAGGITFGDLATTGAATGKTIVCADTNGKLYRSSSAVTCAN